MRISDLASRYFLGSARASIHPFFTSNPFISTDNSLSLGIHRRFLLHFRNVNAR